MLGGMKILGFVLAALAVLLIVPIVVGLQTPGVLAEAVGLVILTAFGLLVSGAVVYGIGRAVEELTLIRKYLKQQHYSDSAKAADLMDQIRRTKDSQP